MSEEQIRAVGIALLPYLRNDLTDAELGMAAHDAVAALNRVAGIDRLRAEVEKRQWQSIETAPKDGTIFDVWLGDALESDLEFYSLPGTRISHAWSWRNGKFRPFTGLSPMAVTIVQPTHWMPLPDPPKETEG